MLGRLWRWFKSFFVPLSDHTNSQGFYDAVDTKDVPLTFSEEIGTKRIALIVGHTKSAQGAISYTQVREYEWNKQRAKEIKAYLDKHHIDKASKIFYRDGIGVKGVATMLDNWEADVAVELHFNSIGTEKNAYGTEILVLKDDDDSAKIANNFVQDISAEFKTRKRGQYVTDDDLVIKGVKPVGNGDRGHYNLKKYKSAGVPIRLLVEPFFAGTKTSESEQFMENPEKYSALLGKVLGEL